MGDTLSCVEPSNPQFKDAPQSDAGSRPPSVNSADVVESVDGSASPVDLNSASEAQLTTIKGIGTKTAANIVAYRTANGPFQTVDDLAKVKGVSAAFVDRLRPSLTVGGGGEGTGGTGDGGGGGGGPPAVIAPCYPTCPCLGPDFPAPIPRPQVESFSGVVRGRPAVRVASWNLQCCSADKMDNNGVREVVCLTLLEQGIKLLAVQELADKVALQKLCAELNAPSLRSVRDWPRPRGDWRCVVSENPTGPMYQSMEYAGFAWDASSGLELLSEGLVRKKKGSKHFARYPYLGYFKAGRFDFTLVNVHLKATGLGNAELEKLQLEIMKLPQLLDLLEEHLSGGAHTHTDRHPTWSLNGPLGASRTASPPTSSPTSASRTSAAPSPSTTCGSVRPRRACTLVAGAWSVRASLTASYRTGGPGAASRPTTAPCGPSSTRTGTTTRSRKTSTCGGSPCWGGRCEAQSGEPGGAPSPPPLPPPPKTKHPPSSWGLMIFFYCC
ncbi:endonuclease/exonuclease/phosphatase family domain-containing protein 1-like isoform X1 [Lampetra fluviatilis]